MDKIVGTYGLYLVEWSRDQTLGGEEERDWKKTLFVPLVEEIVFLREG